MPKGLPKRADEQTLEGGAGSASGGGRSSASRMVDSAVGPGMLVGAGAAGYADYKDTKARQQEKKEAADELKRETRGMAKGGMTASKRADGIAQRGKTRGTIVMCGGGMYKK